MTSFKIECPNCGRKYNVPEGTLGRKVTCANGACGTKFAAEPYQPEERVEEITFTTSGEPSREQNFVHVSPPALRVLARSTRPKQILMIAAAAVVLLFMGLAIGLAGRFAMNEAGKATNPNPNDQGGKFSPKENTVAELLYLTDTTIRLLKKTNDADLAREYINKWKALRGTIPKAETTEVSFDVIEGHLNAIHKSLYPRSSDSPYSSALGWHNAREFSDNQESVDAIRSAQDQLMKVLKIRWNDAQRSNLYSSTLNKLRDEGRRLASMSKVGSNNLPQSLTADEASKLMRDLDILYADVPLDTGNLSHVQRKKGDVYGIPQHFELAENDTAAEWIHSHAACVIFARSHLPVSQNTLKGKTESLKFSESYAKDLDFLRDAVR